MITLTINNQQVTVTAGNTILDAAKKLGVTIPTLCHLDDFKPTTSCMICVVHELESDRLVLSCSMPAEEGMRIETDNERVRSARKDTLDLLLSEHVGDCEAPCQRSCPAKMNIPLMIRQIEENELEAAIITIKKEIALPAVLGRICPAPCEKACHRKNHDSPLSICALKRFAADVDLAKESPYRPNMKPSSGKKIAVIGAGPTGLSAAYYLALDGHECCVYDRNAKPGGLLRYGVPDDDLPKHVLDAEIEQIRALGVTFKTEQTLGTDFSLSDVIEKFDAVILAFGKTDISAVSDDGIEHTQRGIAVDRKTFATAMSGVFAGGNAVSEGKMAIRALAQGKSIAVSVSQHLSGMAVTGRHQRFNSTIGALQNGESNEFIKDAEDHERLSASHPDEGFSPEEAMKESQRCFHCDCRKPVSCKLRSYADEYGADQRQYKFGSRKRVQKNVQHEIVIFEQGKCIKCNLCIEIAKKAGEHFGLTFINRGFDVQLTVPFNESLKNGLQKVARECADACPTAALAMRNSDEGPDSDTK